MRHSFRHPLGFLDATPLTKVKNAGGNQMQIMGVHWGGSLLLFVAL